MFRFFLALLPFLITPESYCPAQEVPMRSSEVFKIEDYRAVKLLGRFEDKVLVSLNHEDKKKLMILNSDLQPRKEYLIKYHFRKKPQDLFVYQDTIYHLYVRKDGVTAFLECERFDLQFKAVDTTLLYAEPYRFRVDYYSGFTEDQSSSYCLFKEDHGKNLKILRFSKDDLVMLDTSILEMKNYEAGQMSYYGAMDPAGNTYFGINRNINSLKTIRSEWQVFKLGPQDDRIYQIKLEDQLSTSAFMDYDAIQDNLFICGYYGHKSEDVSSGYYRILINFNEGGWRVDQEEFTKESVVEMTGKKRFTKRLIPSLEIKDVVLRQDGGMLLLGEHEKIMTQLNDMSMTGVELAPRQVFFLEHMLVSSFDKDFKSEWDQIIFKRQHSQNDDAKYSSFLLLRSTSELCIVVNDQVTNRNTMSKYTIQPSGRVMRRHFVPQNIEYPNIAFRNGVQFNHDHFYVLEYPKPNRFRVLEVGF